MDNCRKMRYVYEKLTNQTVVTTSCLWYNNQDYFKREACRHERKALHRYAQNKKSAFGHGCVCGIAVIITIICMVAHTEEDIYLYAIVRVVQTLFGIFSAMLINVLVRRKDAPDENQAKG